MRPDVNCKVCGALVRNAKRGPPRAFCSVSCRKIDNYRRRTGAQQQPSTVPCAKCGEIIQNKSQGQQRRWCSSLCRSAARSENPVRKRGDGGLDIQRHCSCGAVFWVDSGSLRRACDACRIAQRRTTSAHARLRRRARLAGATTEDVDLEAVARRDGNRCQSCGCRVRTTGDQNHPRYRHFDHIIPVSRGGGHANHNLQVLCNSCNVRKGASLDGQQTRLAWA